MTENDCVVLHCAETNELCVIRYGGLLGDCNSGYLVPTRCTCESFKMINCLACTHVFTCLGYVSAHLLYKSSRLAYKLMFNWKMYEGLHKFVAVCSYKTLAHQIVCFIRIPMQIVQKVVIGELIFMSTA